MTQRERQILNWIEADPMISQQELAERAGITRSSVAVLNAPAAFLQAAPSRCTGFFIHAAHM